MNNKDLRDEFRVANVKQWEVAEAMGISEMTLVKWLRRELPDEKKTFVREAILKAKTNRQEQEMNLKTEQPYVKGWSAKRKTQSEEIW